MSINHAIVLFGAICATILAVAAAVYRPRLVHQWSFLVAISLLAVEGYFQFLSLRAFPINDMIFWQQAANLPLACLPLAWLLFSLTYARGNAIVFLKRWTLGLIIFGALPLFIGLMGWDGIVVDAKYVAPSFRFLISYAGQALHIAMVVSCVLVLANLESTFRSAIGTSRWKIKYAVFGLVLWCGARIYTSSLVLLYSSTNANLIVINSIAVVLASAFVGISLYRAKLSHVDIYPSPTALHRSITFIIAAVYLVVVGLIAKTISSVGRTDEFPLAALVILVGICGLGIFSLSDRVRNESRQFITRHFKRPAYDYRQVWSGFTQRTVGVLDRQEYSRKLVTVISETFEALSVTIWLADNLNRRFAFGASTSLDPRDAASAPVSEAVYVELAPLVREVAHPVDLDHSDKKWCALLKESNPIWFPKTGGHRLCLPLVFGGELAGLLVLGDRVRGVPFSAEDLELLRCLGDQMAAGLCTLNLSEKLVRAKEMEAFQVMSAFLVHDLKNTASALSLTLRNLPVHFENPAFREDALRTMSRSVQRVNELIGRLTSLRRKLEIHARPADLNALVATALKAVGEMPGVEIDQEFQSLPMVPVDAVHVESVLVNLLLNAREAISGAGRIRIATALEPAHVMVSVSDSGCGMSPEFLAGSLFKPFKTSKKTGLGIGMYQTKTVVEAHGGRILVESQPGKGTTFRVLFPLSSPA